MKIRTITRKIPLLILTLLVTLIGSTYATTTAPIQTTNVQMMNGIVLHDNGAFNLTNFAFEPIASNATATASCNWPALLCKTALLAGDWQLVVLLILNKVPTVSKTYTITLNDFGPFSVCSLPFCTPFNAQITFTVPTTATQGTSGSFFFDTGYTAIPQDSAWRITVQ